MFRRARLVDMQPHLQIIQSSLDPSAIPASPAAPLMPVAPLLLPGVIGAELSRPVSVLQSVLHEFERTESLLQAQLNTLIDAVASAHRISRQTQQITRLASGRLRQSHERLSLDGALLDLLDTRHKHFRGTRIEVRHQLRAVDVIVDPGLLSSLLEVAVDWAAEQGQRLQITLTIKNWPEHGVLVVRATQHVAVTANEEDPASPDTLNWYLLQQVAQAMGVNTERVIGTDHAQLQIEFPRTVKQLEGLTAIEVDSGGDSSSFQHSDIKAMAGHRLLLVSDDERLRLDIEAICENMGLMLNTSQTIVQAIRFCEFDKPHMIVIDEKLRDDLFEQLREDLVRNDVNFPFVEIAKTSNTFEMANWMGGSMSRISQDALKAQLPSIFVMELARVPDYVQR